MNRRELQKAFNKANTLKPGPATWGFYHYDDAAPAQMGSIGAFLWFPSRPAMLSFLTKYLPYVNGPRDGDPAAVSESVAGIVKQVQEREIDDKAAVRRLNRKLKDYSQIEWLGQFDDLLQGKSGKFAAMLRKWYRDNHTDQKSSSAPIPKAEVKEFMQAIRMYGC